MTNIELINNFHKKLWDKKDVSAIDVFFADDVKVYNPLEVTTGFTKLKNIMQQWLIALPDIRVTWDDVMTSGSKVVCQWSASGTHLGNFLSFAASGKTINYTGCTIYNIHKNKITDYWAYVDRNNVFTQMQD